MRHMSIGAFVSAVLWTTGCTPLTTDPSVTTTSEGEKTEAPAGKSAAQQGNALVRVVNANAEGKGLDIVWGSETLFGDVAYKSITAYVGVPRGLAQFKLRAAGGTEDLSAGHRELLSGRHYTLVALPKEKGDARLRFLSDNLGLLEPGETRVRLINATTDVNDLDLFIAGTPNRVLHGIDAGAVAATSFVDMEAGNVEIRSPTRPAPTLVAKLKVEGDRLYTFIVVGTASALDVVQIVDHTEP
jgi:hypothetical protein